MYFVTALSYICIVRTKGYLSDFVSGPVVTLLTTRFMTVEFYFLMTVCIYVFFYGS